MIWRNIKYLFYFYFTLNFNNTFLIIITNKVNSFQADIIIKHHGSGKAVLFCIYINLAL